MSNQSSPLKRILLTCFAILGMGVAGVIGAGLGGGAVYLAVQEKLNSITVPSAAPPVVITQPAPAAPAAGPINTTVNIETAVTDAVDKVGPAVITVVNQLAGGGQASGSGVIVSPEGYAVTNNHVVEGNSSLTVIFRDGQTAPASLVGADPVADVAVIKIQGKVPAYAEFGDSEALKPGETVIAIGSPLGDFRNTVTVGVVSATHRSIEGGSGDLIQTDAAINHGNSGGPLVNLAGQVIGINALVVRGNGFTSDQAEGLGFAIAASTAKGVADQLIAKGYVARPFLGISWAAVTPDIATANNLGAQWGAYITQVSGGTPAAQAGLRPGDIITAIGGDQIDQENSFTLVLFKHSPGETVKVTFMRGSQVSTTDVTLVERPRTG
ncbi:MAG: trypsin-like peptidase domain-containing protein [Chloroflexi bacterium]|nr:trypsin-like peptidase domain-containing protein [Chloroflexota bacterium]